MLVMEIYTFMFKMVNKTKNLGSERVAEFTPLLTRGLLVEGIKSRYAGCSLKQFLTNL